MMKYSMARNICGEFNCAFCEWDFFANLNSVYIKICDVMPQNHMPHKCDSSLYSYFKPVQTEATAIVQEIVPCFLKNREQAEENFLGHDQQSYYCHSVKICCTSGLSDTL